MELRKGYKKTEVGSLPNDWSVEKLRDLCSMKSGRTITHQIINDYEIYPCYGGNGQRGYTNSYTHDGNFALIGRQGALCGNVQIISGKIFASEHAIVVSPHLKTDIKWLYYILGDMSLNQYSESSAQPGLSVTKILELAVAVPRTKTEQTAIATALSDTDALINSLEKLIAKKRNIKQGAMQELLTGKRRLPGFTNSKENKKTDAGIIPKDWDVLSFGIIASVRKQKYDSGKLGPHKFCVELEHIGQGTGTLVGFTESSSGSSLKNVFEKDDVLFGRLRAYLKKYWKADRPGISSSEIWPLVTNQQFSTPEYLFQIVQTRYFIESASEAYGTHMPRSDWNIIKKTLIPLSPNIAEQSAIATILSEMDAEIAALESKLVKYKMLKQGMMQELLTGRIRLV